MSTVKKNYFKDVFKSGYLLIALLFTSIAMTAFVMSYDFGLFKLMFKFESVLKYVIVVFAVFAEIAFLYLIASLFSKKACFADAFYIAALLTGIAFFLYIQITYGSFNLRRILVPAIAGGLGILLLVLRIVLYYKVNLKSKTTYSKFRLYYSEVFNKYSFFAIVVGAGLLVCFIYKFLNSETIYKLLKNEKFELVSIICLIPLVVCSAISVFLRKVNFFDAFLHTGIITLPAVAVQINLRSYSEQNLIIWAIAVALFLICVIIRYARFTPNLKPAVIKCNSKCYLKQLFARSDMLVAMTISGLIAFIAIQLLVNRSIHNYLFENGVTLNKIHISLKALPTIVLAGISLFILGFSALITLIGVKRKTACIADFFLAICTLFVLFGFITLIAYPSKLYLYGLIAFGTYCLIMIIVRAIVVKKS